GLASWWWPWAVRCLVRAGRPARPALLHVLHAEMDLAGLALAEAWRVPYLQTVDDYLPPGGTLRLSRRGCRGGVGAGPGRAERLGIAGRVTFTAERGAEPMFWGVLDLYCQAALRPCAGRPLAAALARGIPAVAADVEGLRAWVDDGRAGRLVPPGDPDAMAR